jgi:hypothetical protein
MDNEPWRLNPAFTDARLTFLGKRLLSIRANVIALQDPGKGDSSWVLGCRAYEWQRYQLSLDALSGDYPWLVAVALPNRQFDVKVGGHPIHIFRGEADDPDARQVLRGHEKRQMSLFETDGDEEDDDNDVWANYLAVETDSEGNGLRVVFFQANPAGKTRNQWIVPTGDSIDPPSVTRLTPKEGPDVPRPTVRPRVPSQRRGHGDDGEGSQ